MSEAPLGPWHGLVKRHPSEAASMLMLSRRPRDVERWADLAEKRRARGDAEGALMASLHASQAARFTPGMLWARVGELPGWWHAREEFDGELVELSLGRAKAWVTGAALEAAFDAKAQGLPFPETPFDLEGASGYVPSQEHLEHVFGVLSFVEERGGPREGARRRGLPWRHASVELFSGRYALVW